MKQIFNIDNVQILKEIINKRINSIIYTKPTIGNVGLEFDDNIVEISNYIKEAKFINNYEEISQLSIKKYKNKNQFNFLLKTAPKCKLNINEKIEKIKVVNDLIHYHDKIDISYDVGIIIETTEHKYIIARDWAYSDSISVEKDEEFDIIVPKMGVLDTYRQDKNDDGIEICRREYEI